MLNLKSLQLDLTDWTLHQEQAESAIYFDFDSKALFNLSDQQKYDTMFPNSPLSRAHRKLTPAIDSVQFDRYIIDAPDFTNERSS